MSKYSRGLDAEYVELVKKIADEMHLRETGINVEAVCLNKSKKDVGVVLKANDLVELFTGDNSTVVVAINENAYARVDKETQEMWTRGLLNQISYDMDKDKINIVKPEMNLSYGIYAKYKDQAVRACELAILTMQQICEEEAERKASKKKKN